jgi:hypothetical protein
LEAREAHPEIENPFIKDLNNYLNYFPMNFSL